MNHKLFLIPFFCFSVVISVSSHDSQTPVCGSVEKDVNAILSSWKERDWKHMYSLVSSKSKNRKGYLSFKKKMERMQKISKLDGYRSLSAERTSSSKAVAHVKLYMLYSPQTSYMLTDKWKKKTVDVKWNLACENGAWKVVLSK